MIILEINTRNAETWHMVFDNTSKEGHPIGPKEATLMDSITGKTIAVISITLREISVEPKTD